MEQRRPDYEDEKIRFWKERLEGRVPERDPTVLDIDLTREEIFESRVYSVNPETYVSVVIDVLADHANIPPELVLQRLIEGLDDSSFRFLAKREREGEQLLSWIQISLFGGRRELIERVDARPEDAFRESVGRFEADALAGGVVFPPTVVTLDEWRQHELRDRPQS